MKDRGYNMGEIRGIVSRELEHKFRMLAMKKFGYRKGSFSKALEQAVHYWINLIEEDDSDHVS